MHLLDRFHSTFNFLLRNKTDFYIEDLLEQQILSNTLPAMSKGIALHGELATRFSRIRMEMDAYVNCKIRAEEAVFGIKADANEIIKDLKRVERGLPQLIGTPEFYERLWYDWQDRTFHPFIEAWRFGGQIDRIWNLFGCLSQIEQQMMAVLDGIEDLKARRRPAALREHQKSLVKAEPADQKHIVTAIQSLQVNAARKDRPRRRIPKPLGPVPQERQGKASMKTSPGPSNLYVIEETAAPRAGQIPASTVSFSVVEEKIARLGLGEPTTTEPVNYTTQDTDSSDPPYAGPPQLGSVIPRNGRSIPRMFTGSDLEDMHTSNSVPSATGSETILGRVKIKNFATPPQGTPDTSSPSSPALQIHFGEPRPLSNLTTDPGLLPATRAIIDCEQPPTASDGVDLQPSRPRPCTTHRAGSRSAGSSVAASREPSRNREHTL